VTRTLIGFDYTGTPCVKVTKGNYNPKTTPDGDLNKFLFSSKWRNHVGPAGIDKADFLSGSSQVTYLPSGSNNGNFRRRRHRAAGTPTVTVYHYRKAYFETLRYNMPLIDVAWKRISNGRFTQRRIWHMPRGIQTSAGTRGGFHATGAALEFGWGGGLVVDSVNTLDLNLGYGTFLTANNSNPASVLSPDVGMHKRLIVWNLPGDDTPLDGPTSTPSGSGKMAIQISKSQFRVAKPGYDVRTAAPRYLAFDANNRPMRIIAAADVSVPVGTSVHDLDISIPEEAVADVHFYSGSAIQYPAHPYDGAFGADYWFAGSTIRFSNPNRACRARFIVMAYDDAPPTSGSNRVLRQLTWRGENHVQVLRPGSAASPSFADVVMDTRWPVPQILKEGYISVGSGTRSYTVDYNGAGMFVFVKYATHHGSYRRVGQRFSQRVRPPFAKIVRWTDGAHGGDSTYVTYHQSRAVFHTHKGAIVDRYYNDKGTLVSETDTNPIIGLRYYILGVPT